MPAIEVFNYACRIDFHATLQSQIESRFIKFYINVHMNKCIAQRIWKLILGIEKCENVNVEVRQVNKFIPQKSQKIQIRIFYSK